VAVPTRFSVPLQALPVLSAPVTAIVSAAAGDVGGGAGGRMGPLVVIANDARLG